MKILLVVVPVVLVLLALDAANRRRVAALRASGLYPPRGAGSDGDVQRLMLAGHKIAAIKLHREIHGVGLKEAKEAVEALARALPPRH